MHWYKKSCLLHVTSHPVRAWNIGNTFDFASPVLRDIKKMCFMNKDWPKSKTRRRAFSCSSSRYNDATCSKMNLFFQFFELYSILLATGMYFLDVIKSQNKFMHLKVKKFDDIMLLVQRWINNVRDLVERGLNKISQSWLEQRGSWQISRNFFLSKTVLKIRTLMNPKGVKGGGGGGLNKIPQSLTKEEGVRNRQKQLT